MQSNKVVKEWGASKAYANANPIAIGVTAKDTVDVTPGESTEGSSVTVTAAAPYSGVCVRIGGGNGTCACNKFAGVVPSSHLQASASPFTVAAGASGANGENYTVVAVPGGATTQGNTGDIYIGH